MDNANITNFTELVRSIQNNKILLPDFQREFVWTDEEEQKKLVASVLAKMPIGSILLLESSPSEYSCKKVGCKTKVDSSTIKTKVHFLLDGQQRITVLSNVFSNVIQENADNVSDLVNQTGLKRRFFLCLPHWSDVWNNTDIDDLFGVRTLVFPMANPDDNPPFLSKEVKGNIEVISFTAQDNKPYNPKTSLGPALDNFCEGYERGYLIPLYLVISYAKTAQKKNKILLRFDEILRTISERIAKDIRNHFSGLSDDDTKQFIEDFLKDPDDIQEIKESDWDEEVFFEIIDNRASIWRVNLKAYIESCLKNMVLNTVDIKEEDRKRAIEIYENMNIGGVRLNTFDLIMAKVAMVNNERYLDRIIEHIKTSDRIYPSEVLPDEMENIVKPILDSKQYNATLKSQIFTSKENMPVDKYIDAFLDVLSILCNNQSYDPEINIIPLIKRDKILDLAPDKIDSMTEKTIDSLDRAMYFFHTRCGICKINDINNSLIIVLVSVVLSNDTWYKNKKVHKLLEGWYWASIFSGEFDKDQNSALNRNLSSMIKTINNNMSTDWITRMKENVLVTNNFSDKKLLLMEKAKDEERVPKNMIKDFMCQFLLSRSYPDLFDANKTISVFCDECNELEKHHIIPLGSCSSYGESSNELRKNNNHLLNSPLNFVYITAKTNKAISDDSLPTYFGRINNQAKSALHISGITVNNSPKEILESRFADLQGDIQTRISNLI